MKNAISLLPKKQKLHHKIDPDDPVYWQFIKKKKKKKTGRLLHMQQYEERIRRMTAALVSATFALYQGKHFKTTNVKRTKVLFGVTCQVIL